MTLEYKGTYIFYSDQGKGSTIVLLHGFLENSLMWIDVKSALVKGYRVITIDLLGHGQTGCLGYIHTMEQMADAVLAVLKSLRLRRVVMIGHSMGGYVALALAQRSPNMIKGLCLMNSTAQADDKDRKGLRVRANKMAQRNFNNMVRMSVGNLFYAKNLKQLEQEVQRTREQALKTPVQGYIAANEGMRIRSDRKAVLQELQSVFYVIGLFDPVLNAKVILEEATAVNAHYVILEGGHMSHLENTGELIVALKKFLSLAK